MDIEEQLEKAGFKLEWVESGTYCYELKSEPETGDFETGYTGVWGIAVFMWGEEINNVFSFTQGSNDACNNSRELGALSVDDVLTLARLLGLSKEVE